MLRRGPGRPAPDRVPWRLVHLPGPGPARPGGRLVRTPAGPFGGPRGHQWGRQVHRRESAAPLHRARHRPHRGQRPSPARGYPVAGWRASLAWVSQRPHLFDGSIADNIRLARPGASDDAVAKAVASANATEFIERLPRGLDTPVGEAGARMSGGQRQRIAIARAFLRDAPVVVLDEATSHQDEASDSPSRTPSTVSSPAGPCWSSPTGCASRNVPTG